MENRYNTIACSLTVKDAARQRLEWADLERRALTAHRIDRGAVMTFDSDLGETIEGLAARERSCCGFMSITTSRTGDRIQLEITTDDAGALALIRGVAGVGEG